MSSFEFVKETVWDQYGAAIDMLENAMEACPDDLWSDRSTAPHLHFYYMVFHTLFWTDYYLDADPETFRPPAPFTMDEMDPAGVYPDRAYTKDELRRYLVHGREKVRRIMAGLTEQQAMRTLTFFRREHSMLNVLLYNLRHVQHHTAQLNLILRQVVDDAPRWVGHSSVPLHAKEPA